MASMKTTEPQKMIRVWVDVYSDEDVHVYAVSGNNLNRMPKIPSKTITRAELSEMDDSFDDDSVFAKACFELLDISYS